MLSETVVSTLLEASITGAGLVLAVYALITPMSEKIFKERARRLQHLIEEFEKEKNKITADASNKDFKRLKKLRDEIKEIRIFPRYLSIGILITFISFMLSVIVDGGWLAQPLNRTSENEFAIYTAFVVAIVLFLFVGILTIFEIFNTMRKEFEDVKKKQKEAKKFKTALVSLVAEKRKN